MARTNGDAFVRTNRRVIAAMFVRLSVTPSGTGVHCDHNLALRLLTSVIVAIWPSSLWFDGPV